MLLSFMATKSPTTDIVIYLDNDDPRLAEYDVAGYDCIVGDRKNVIALHNEMARVREGYDYYMPINDDIIFRTPSWDKKLISEIKGNGGWGIAYPNDLSGNNRIELPTFGVISANIVDTLGYIYPENLLALLGDVFLKDLGSNIGKLFYRADVIIEHNHTCLGKAKNDEIYSYAESRHQQDKLEYKKYVETKMASDVEKILNAIRDNNPKLCANGLLKTMH